MTEENIAESQPSPENTSEPVQEPAPEAVRETGVYSAPAPEPVFEEPTESFADLLRDFERSHARKPESGTKQLQGTVVSLTADQVVLDIGCKTEGVLPRSAFENNAEG